LSATNLGGTTTATLNLTVEPPQPVITSVVNVASFAAGPPAAGSWVALFGANLSGQNVSVTCDGVVSTLSYAGSTQVNFVIPSEAGWKGWTEVVVIVDGQESAPMKVPLTGTSPGIFTPGILNQDYTVNGASNPAAPGSVIQIYLTGLVVGGGSFANVDIGDRWGLTPLYAGPAPGVAGMQQVNVAVPNDLSVSHAAVEVCVAHVGGGVPKICSPTVDLSIGTGAGTNVPAFRRVRRLRIGQTELVPLDLLKN